MKETSGVYTTKLPFIENMICVPAVLELVCQELNFDYSEVLVKVEEQLIKALWQKLKEALPINLGIGKNERIKSLEITATTKKKGIAKSVNQDNILYAYRSKVIISIVASELQMKKREEYYAQIIKMFKDESYRNTFVKIMSNYVHKFEPYNFEEI